MKTLIILAMLLIPSAISCAEFRPDPVLEFIESQPKISIDMTGYRSKFKTNYELKRKNFPKGTRRK